MYTVAIHPDTYGPDNSDRMTPYWIEYLEARGCRIKTVNVYAPDILSQLQGCQGFMWRWFHGGQDAKTALRLIPVLENYMGVLCFPDVNTCWHYDDKATQAYLFQACSIPTPRTWFFTQEKEAQKWLESQAQYPLVLKLTAGAGSTNVLLLQTKYEAQAWLPLLFHKGVTQLRPDLSCKRRLKQGLKLLLQSLYSGWPDRTSGWPTVHKGYALFQEFLPNNAYDTRVTVVGNRAFCFRRWNRDNDFRASGSGKIDYSLNGIDVRFIHLAFDVAKKLHLQSVAIDGLWDGNAPVVGEISYTYVQHPVHSCPGHWSLTGEPHVGELEWHGGHLWPATAMAEDFYTKLRANNDSK